MANQYTHPYKPMKTYLFQKIETVKGERVQQIRAATGQSVTHAMQKAGVDNSWEVLSSGEACATWTLRTVLTTAETQALSNP